MENIKIEMLLFSARNLVVSLRENKPIFELIFDFGSKYFNEIIEYLVENQEISNEEKEILENNKVIFNYSKEKVLLMELLKQEVLEGKEHWKELSIDLLEEMLSINMISEENAIRYLAHKNNYHQVIAWSENKKDLFELAKKYGSERTQIQFKNYETMKKMEEKLPVLEKKEKRIKI